MKKLLYMALIIGAVSSHIASAYQHKIYNNTRQHLRLRATFTNGTFADFIVAPTTDMEPTVIEDNRCVQKFGVAPHIRYALELKDIPFKTESFMPGFRDSLCQNFSVRIFGSNNQYSIIPISEKEEWGRQAGEVMVERLLSVMSPEMIATLRPEALARLPLEVLIEAVTVKPEIMQKLPSRLQKDIQKEAVIAEQGDVPGWQEGEWEEEAEQLRQEAIKAQIEAQEAIEPQLRRREPTEPQRRGKEAIEPQLRGQGAQRIRQEPQRRGQEAIERRQEPTEPQRRGEAIEPQRRGEAIEPQLRRQGAQHIR